MAFIGPSSGEQNSDLTRFRTQEVQRELQRNQLAQAKILSRVRLILRRVLGRQVPPASP
jgi:hypothetical protein